MTVYVSPAEAFLARARATPEALFLRAPSAAELPYARDGFSHSYGDVQRGWRLSVTSSRNAGYGQGSCIALMLDNRPEFFWIWFALNESRHFHPAA